MIDVFVQELMKVGVTQEWVASKFPSLQRKKWNVRLLRSPEYDKAVADKMGFLTRFLGAFGDPEDLVKAQAEDLARARGTAGFLSPSGKSLKEGGDILIRKHPRGPTPAYRRGSARIERHALGHEIGHTVPVIGRSEVGANLISFLRSKLPLRVKAKVAVPILAPAARMDIQNLKEAIPDIVSKIRKFPLFR